MYKTENLDMWREFVTQSPHEAEFSIQDKPYLKILFYAALNGGVIKTMDDMARHLSNSTRSGGAGDKSMYNFSKNPLYKELLNVKSFWQTFSGEMYVPTRNEKIIRKSSQADFDRALAKKLPYISPVNSPLTHRLPTVYFTSMEIIYIIKVACWVLEFGFHNNLKISLVQGIHDGMMFMVEEHGDISEILNYVNLMLKTETQQTFGIIMSASLVDCQDPDWVSKLHLNVVEP